jgi:hypothetical protein
VIKPVVAFDIDGTMGDYHSHLLYFAAEYLGTMGIEDWRYAGHETFNSWFCRVFECDYRTWQDIKLAYRQGAQKRSMSPFKDMVRVAQTSERLGCEVWVTTTRPYQRLDGIDPDTREWLRRNRVPYEGLIYSEDKYDDLAERIEPDRVIAIFDDLVEMYDRAEELFGPSVPFLFRSVWNRARSRPNRGDSGGAMRHLKDRFATWKEHHEASAA